MTGGIDDFLPTKSSDYYDLLYFSSDCHIVSFPLKLVAITQFRQLIQQVVTPDNPL